MRTVLITAVVLLMLLPAQRLEAQAQVRNVTVRNAGVAPLDEAFVKAHISVRTNTRLDPQQIANDVEALLGTGRFTSVRVEYEKDGTEVSLTYVIVPKYRLLGPNPIEVLGVESTSEGRVLDLLDLHGGDFIDDRTLAVRSQKVLDHYRKHFYPSSRVTWVMEEDEDRPDRVRVIMTVDEGDRARLRRVRIWGNAYISDRDLRRVVRSYKWYNPFSWYKGVHVDPDGLEVVRHAISQVYAAEGFLDVEVETPLVVRDPDEHYALDITIVEGPQYRFGETEVSGVTLFPEEEIKALITIPTGEIATLPVVEANSRRLRDYYGSRGYINVRAIPMMEPDVDRDLVNVKYRIVEGELTHIRNVLIRGNDRTRDKVIRRELQVYPGDQWDGVKVRRSEARVRNLGFFSQVNAQPLPNPGDPGSRDLAIDIVEKRTGSMMLGFGFSSVDKLIGFVELSQANFDISGWPFMGAGQKLNLRAQAGTRRQDYRIAFTEPWFLDRKLSLGVDLYSRERDFEGYDVARLGGGISLGKPIGGGTRMDMSYRLERSRIIDVTNTNAWYDEDAEEPNNDSVYRFETDVKAVESSIRLRLTRDTRNRFFNPSRGRRVTGSVHTSGGILGFDTELWGADFRIDQYCPLWLGHVFSIRLRGEVVVPFTRKDEDELELFDKLFIGGGRTIRGYDFRDVGPKVVQLGDDDKEIDHRPIGGEALINGIIEYIVPVVDGIRLAAFVDAGNVYEEIDDVDLGELASSVGVELRLDVPGFPIRISYAVPLKKDDDLTDEDKVGFWIGN